MAGALPHLLRRLLAVLTSLLLIVSLCSAKPHSPVQALLSPITKDAATTLYTIPIANAGAALVVDIGQPAVSSLCSPRHTNVHCLSKWCDVAARDLIKVCHSGEPLCSSTTDCVGRVRNPATGTCSSGDLTTMKFDGNATDGMNPLFRVSFSAVGVCETGKSLSGLPSGSAGVAGLGCSPLALQRQLALKLKTKVSFGLCLPSSGTGVAVFGRSTLFLLPPGLPEITKNMAFTPLVNNPRFPAYYIEIKAIAVNQNAVPLPGGALALNPKVGTGGVLLSTTTPYTALRSDIYGPVISTFSRATSGYARAPAVAPFELCYRTSALTSTRLGYGVPQVDLVLAGGANWTVFGANSLATVGGGETACFAFVKMREGEFPEAPAVVLGGFQMENNYVVFDETEKKLGFSYLLFGRMTTCSNFNFTVAE